MFNTTKRYALRFGALALLCACGSPASTAVQQPPDSLATPQTPKTRPQPLPKATAQWTSSLPAGSALRAAVLDREGDIILAPTLSSQGEIAKRPLAQGLTLLALKTSGEVRWQRHVSQSVESLVRAIVETQDGDYVIAGTFAGKIDVDGHRLQSQGDRDAFVAKVSGDGKFRWLRSLGGLAREQATTLAISDDGARITIGGWAESSFRFAGKEYASRGTAKDGFVATFEAEGAPVWATRYQGVGVDQVHGLAYEGDDLAVLGSFTTAMQFPGFTAKSRGERDLFCVRHDPEGQVQWSRSWGSDQSELGIDLHFDERGEFQLLALVEGDIQMGDSFHPAAGKSDILLWTLDSGGDMLASQRYGGTESFVATDAEGTTVSGYYRGQGKVAHLQLPASNDERGLQLQLGPQMELLSLEAVDLERLLFTRRRFGAELQVGLLKGQVKIHFRH